MTHAARRRCEAKEGVLIKLRAGQYLRRLHAIAAGADKLEPAQVPAFRLKAEIYLKLLAKCLPDLRAIEHSGELMVKDASQFTDAELAIIITGSGEGIAETQDSQEIPSGIH